MATPPAMALRAAAEKGLPTGLGPTEQPAPPKPPPPNRIPRPLLPGPSCR